MQIITIAQHKGGTGKTTLAAHIAVAYSLTGKKVALIDTDAQNSLSTWWHIRQQNLNSNNDISFYKVLGSELINLTSSLKNTYDLVIIDSPPHASRENYETIKISDFIIVPTQLSPVDLWAMNSTIKFITESDRNYRILLNRYNPNLKLSKGLHSHLPNKIFKAYLSNKTAYSLAMLNGKTVIEITKKGSAAHEINSLVEEITTICEL